MSTNFQLVAMVRVPLGTEPPAAVNGSLLISTLPLARDSQIGSLPDVESFRSADASAVPSSIESMKLDPGNREAVGHAWLAGRMPRWMSQFHSKRDPLRKDQLHPKQGPIRRRQSLEAL